jgi:DNA (cytosine-5)-methyltransferase 1
MTELTAVSLFAGVGGFELALGNHGVKVVASVEIDDAARGVLAHKFPDSKLFSDVKEVTGDDLITAGFIPERGIITGGFPCQDLSVAGKRAGLDGARSVLYWEIVRLAEETQSKWLVLENVPGLLTSQSGRDMGIVLGTLVDRGYSVSWRVLDAQHFGVPQRRRRVFIVAGRTTDRRVGQILLEPEGSRRDLETSNKTGQGITSSVTNSTRKKGKPILASGKDIANCIPAELYHHGSVVNQDANNGHLVVHQNN